MPTSLPIIRGTSVALYPFTQTFRCFTLNSDGQNATAVRSVKAYPLVRFEFNYDLLSKTDKNTLKAAFESAKGQFSTDRYATIDGVQYNNLSFDSDEFQATETQSTIYGSKWTLTQAVSQDITTAAGASGAAYPQLSNGAPCQLPYVQKKRFQTTVSKVDCGAKYTFAQFAGGLSGFPTDGLMSWEFNESGLINSEVTAKINHFLANWGTCYPFTFTDENGVTYSHVYYGSDELSVVRHSYNMSSIRTSLVQMA